MRFWGIVIVPSHATDPLNIVEHLIERRRCQNNHGGEHFPDKFQEPVAEAIIAERMDL